MIGKVYSTLSCRTERYYNSLSPTRTDKDKWMMKHADKPSNISTYTVLEGNTFYYTIALKLFLSPLWNSLFPREITLLNRYMKFNLQLWLQLCVTLSKLSDAKPLNTRFSVCLWSSLIAAGEERSSPWLKRAKTTKTTFWSRGLQIVMSKHHTVPMKSC